MSLFVPKNHSNNGEGTFAGRGTGLISVAEHVSENVPPAIARPEEEMVTDFSKSTVDSNNQMIFHNDTIRLVLLNSPMFT